MEFESASIAAERLGCSLRAVQKWAKEGKIEGAKKVGRDWMIPVTAARPGNLTETTEKGERLLIGMPLPFMEGYFEPGKAMEYIQSIGNENDRKIALGEYYYYIGETEKCSEIMEAFANHPNPSIMFSAALMGTFANTGCNHIHKAHFAAMTVKNELEKGRISDSEPELHAMGVFTAWILKMQFHIPLRDVPPIEEYMIWLPGGHRLFAGYLMAYKALMENDYSRAIGIADASLAFRLKDYPLSTMYLYIVKAIALMGLKSADKAKDCMKNAWLIGESEGFVMPFVEHYNMLHGLTEVFFKQQYPEVFQKIITASKSYNAAWFKIHNDRAEDTVADNLSLTEFTIAMLYNRNWKAKDIADYMELSERTIKNHIQVIYEKLGIGSKKELHQFMIK